MSNSNYIQLLQKLDAFIRKYYKNQLLRGTVYFALAMLFSFLLVVLLEYFGRYNSLVRAMLFYGFFTFTLYCLVKFVFLPLMGMYKLGKSISHQQASELIGKHFPEVSDVLLNTLQLQNTASQQNNILLEAAINQKAAHLKPIPFTDAVNIKQNIKRTWLVLIPLLVYGLMYLFTPGIISSATERLVKYNQTFVAPAPFSFEVENDELQTAQYTDFELNIAVTGKTIPNEVFVKINSQAYRMQKIDKTHYQYTFRNVNKDIVFKLSAADFSSENYALKVIAKPSLVNYTVKLQYPNYISKANEILENPGDLNLPAGTTATWVFNTAQTDEVMLGFGGKETLADKQTETKFTYSKKLLLSTPYFIKNKNKGYGVADSLSYLIQVMPDAFPAISIDEKSDSITGKQLFFIGDVSDDYGLTKLVFTYKFIKSETESRVKQGQVNKVIVLTPQQKNQRFYFEYNLNETGVSAADELEYYFEVWDNDGVRGAKSTRSKILVYKAPTEKEFQKELDLAGKNLKSDLQEAISESKKLQKELKSLQQKMVEKRELTWEEKKKAEELLKRQRDLVAKIEDIKKQQEHNTLKENEFKAPDPELMEKQQQIEKMFNELVNDDLKKLMKEMEKLLQKQDKDAIKQEMDKLQMNNKDVEKELDRMLEQFKQL
jgi:hypothetical protein